MCNEETHLTLTQPEHFTRHTMKVELACAALRHGRDDVSPDLAKHDAEEALLLADKDVARECTHMLELVVSGNLPAAARL